MHPSYHLVGSSLSLEVEYLFGRFQSFFVDGCSAVICDFVVFLRGGELRSFYSVTLSGDPHSFNCSLNVGQGSILCHPHPWIQVDVSTWNTVGEG